jgi:Arc/MetJ-type ribon-helix-helix transcriptional regulator
MPTLPMKSKIALSLDQELIEFIDQQTANRSEYINQLLIQQRSQVLREQMIAALQADLDDASYQADLADWDNVVGDGIDAEG